MFTRNFKEIYSLDYISEYIKECDNAFKDYKIDTIFMASKDVEYNDWNRKLIYICSLILRCKYYINITVVDISKSYIDNRLKVYVNGLKPMNKVDKFIYKYIIAPIYLNISLSKEVQLYKNKILKIIEEMEK